MHIAIVQQLPCAVSMYDQSLRSRRNTVGRTLLLRTFPESLTLPMLCALALLQSAADAHCEYGFVELAPTGLIIHEVIVWAEVAYIWAVSFTALALIHARRGSIRLNFQTSAVLVLMGGNLMLTLCYGIDPACKIPCLLLQRITLPAGS